MTNLEKIKSMTEDELVEFLLSIADATDIYTGYCSNICPYRDTTCEGDCLISDERIVREWLNSKEEA